MFKSKKGFTLIELLIVITIIGILAAALLPNILGAPARARDAARLADLNNIAAALEAYNADIGNYPAAQTCLNDTNAAYLLTYMTGGVPTDPSATNVLTMTGETCIGEYYYCPVGNDTQNYAVIAGVERTESANGLGTAIIVATNCGAAGTNIALGVATDIYAVIK